MADTTLRWTVAVLSLTCVVLAAVTLLMGFRLRSLEQWRTGIGQRVTRLEEVTYP